VAELVQLVVSSVIKLGEASRVVEVAGVTIAGLSKKFRHCRANRIARSTVLSVRRLKLT
jgi:hypothetical protein